MPYRKCCKKQKKILRKVYSIFIEGSNIPLTFPSFLAINLAIGRSVNHELCPVQGFSLLKGRKKLSCCSVFSSQVKNESNVMFFMSALTFYKKKILKYETSNSIQSKCTLLPSIAATGTVLTLRDH